MPHLAPQYAAGALVGWQSVVARASHHDSAFSLAILQLIRQPSYSGHEHTLVSLDVSERKRDTDGQSQ